MVQPWIPGTPEEQFPGQKWNPNIAGTAPVFNGVKRWDGSTWAMCPVKQWNGAQWVGGVAKTWTGSTWKTL